MMKVLCGAVLSALVLAAGQASAACQWPAWEQLCPSEVEILRASLGSITRPSGLT
jgi:endo-1,4-beta-D-glucanase Y